MSTVLRTFGEPHLAQVQSEADELRDRLKIAHQVIKQQEGELDELRLKNAELSDRLREVREDRDSLRRHHEDH